MEISEERKELFDLLWEGISNWYGEDKALKVGITDNYNEICIKFKNRTLTVNVHEFVGKDG